MSNNQNDKKTYYITTPIYYPNSKLHIGHSYTTVAADTMTRYKKMLGYDCCFLTGTDEHGQKVQKAAEAAGVPPKEYVDEIVVGIKKLWELMNVDYDIYIRTTDDNHVKTVQKIFKKLYDKGDIYKSSYEGKYCTPCETFFTEHQLEDGKCPTCGRNVETVKEESYFFKLSKYQDRILDLFENNPDFIQPKSRANEMINNFLKPGLEDLAVSRTSFTWGIPVEFDEGHVVYVWIDALSNYITALGYDSENDELFKKYWPANVHLMAKEIVRFHSIIWPAILMALDVPVAKQVFGHGWLVIDGNKMGKSTGNVVDPVVLVNEYGVDAIRYFLMREIPMGHDGNFTNEALIQRINADLANDLGNLLSRTVGMIDKYFGGELPSSQVVNPLDDEIEKLILETATFMENSMDKFLFSDVLVNIWKLISRTNKYIDETSPWVLAKDEANNDKLANILYVLAEVLRVVSILITPFMPNTPISIRNQLNIDESICKWENVREFRKMPKEVKTSKAEVVFPRIDMKLQMEKLAKMSGETEDVSNEETNKNSKKDKKNAKKKTEPVFDEETGMINIDYFSNVNMKTGKVLECEKLEGSDKLLKLQVEIGGEKRQILSGLAQHFEASSLVGKTVIVVVNLKPVKLRGTLSEGMILTSEDENGKLSLLGTHEEVVSGCSVR